MLDLISDMYHQNRWANRVLFDACRGLSETQLAATAPGVYGSIASTLQHIVAAETGYAIRLGATDVARLKSDDPWPGLDRLAELVDVTATAVIALGRAGSDMPIRTDAPAGASDVHPGVIFVQMFHHSTEHRSQVCTILTTLGIAPPELSAWSWGITADRVRCVLCGSGEHYGVDHAAATGA